ncbi:hypothetical protein GCM10011316_36160 [Roseibium aquae]|uniref:Uncharacterized protein n=1 Tax=Roseibium aquae TaxID=1323746 RepID=A0A916TMJ4_9HYPH|nr:hypothetical protein GCM10011316_36160 [Roseibium aquae]
MARGGEQAFQPEPSGRDPNLREHDRKLSAGTGAETVLQPAGMGMLNAHGPWMTGAFFKIKSDDWAAPNIGLGVFLRGMGFGDMGR